MKSIATRNNTTIDLQQYIKKELFDETGRQEIWLHNLPNTSFLFDIINKLREKYKDDTFVIKQNINITNKKINKEINFSNCIFQKNVNLSGCLFYKNSTFSYIKNKQGEIIANATIFQKEVNFFKANFKEHVNFSGCNFNLKANFSETIFGIKKEDNNSDESSSEVKFLIENAKFQKEVNFSKAIFYDAIYFSGTEFYTDTKVYEEESINFENAQFKRKVRFHHCKFHNTVRFENTSFNKLVDLYCAHFYKPQQFHFTDFLDRAIFSSIEFDEEVQFLHCRVDSNSYIRFESATFKKSLDISRSNFNDKANFWNIELEEGDILTSSKYQNDFPKETKTESTKNTPEETETESTKNTPTIYKKIRETYRIIKSNFYSQNNKIEGLKFYKREMSVYEREIRFLSWDKIRFLSWDKILLFANKISSNFGTSWSRGLLFTVIAGIITLLPISCNLKFSLTLEGVGNFLKGLVDILNLTDWNEMTILGEKLTNWQYIFLFIGRIFVAYGYYQTIQAFRKFGKS